MKIAYRERISFSFLGTGLIVMPLALAAASCSTLALEDAAPTTLAAAPDRPLQPDGYPNLNVPMEAAAPQIAEDERQRTVEELDALRRKQQAQAGVSAAESEAERLRALARSHAEQALREIEAAE